MKKIFLLINLFIFLLLIQINVFAYDSRGMTVAEALKISTAIFAGKVVAQEYQEITDPTDNDFGAQVLTIKIKTERWWKGNSLNEVVLNTHTVRNRLMGWTRRVGCDLQFEIGKTYLVYANNSKNGLLVSLDAKYLSVADEDLKMLGAGFAPQPETKEQDRK